MMPVQDPIELVRDLKSGRAELRIPVGAGLELRPVTVAPLRRLEEDMAFFAALRNGYRNEFFDTSKVDEAGAVAWSQSAYERDWSQINFVIEQGNGERLAFIGLTGLDFGKHTGEMARVMRAPQVRKQGLMTATLSALRGWALNGLRLETIRLECFADNEPAIGLYHRCGFIETGRHVRWLRPGSGSWVRDSGGGDARRREVVEMEWRLAH